MKCSLLLVLSIITLSGALVACSSSVKLDDVPVESKTGTSVTIPFSDSSGATNKAVQPILIYGAEATAGSVGIVRIIYFDYDSFIIKPEFQTVIEAHAKYLAVSKSHKLVVEGNTDERGGREYNLALGQKRAEAVRRGLGLLGVTDAQVEAVSFGKEKPVATGSDEAALAKNRRAELNYR